MKCSIFYFILYIFAANSSVNSTPNKDLVDLERNNQSSSLNFHDPWNEYFEKLYQNASKYFNIHEFSKERYEFLSDAQAKCFDDVKYIFHHLKSKWAIQMLDANGKVPSGTLLGNFLWMGKYKECLDVHFTAKENDSLSNINGVYCVATWNVTAPSNFHLLMQQLPVKTGLCLPESCSSLNITRDMKHLVSFLHRLPFLREYGELLDLNSLTCKEQFPGVSTSAKIFLYILGAYFTLIIAGSCITAFEYIQSCFKNSSSPSRNGSESSTFSDFVSEEDLEGDTCLLHDENCATTQVSWYRYRCDLFSQTVFKNSFKASLRFLKSFCFFSNASKILDTESSSKNFLCIHGIRFLSMAWVILGHTYIHNLNIIGNSMDLLRSVDNFPFQTVIQGTFSVDSFFLMSGFLLCYLFLEESDKRNGKINLFILCLHRFIRLTPVYALLIAFNTLVFKYTGSGPFWGEDSNVEACKKYWWWNLLYINNFLPMESMCLTWTWYLANDMQFFLMGVLILTILWRWPVVGLAISSALLICSWILTWCISYSYDLIPLFVGLSTASDYDSYKNGLLLNWNRIYSKPYCRCGPYIIGILLAYIMYQRRDSKWNLNLGVKSFGWCCATLCSLSVIFGLYHVKNNETLFHFYNALSRSAFCLALAWVIFCCLSGNGGLVDRFLSLKIWIPLSRLTYCAYMFHPLIMSWYFESQETPFYFTHVNMIMLYFGFLVVSYITAFAISVIFETPIINIEKMLKKRNS
ncbi:nose resistant to fluoxetine protein 6-like [Argiope bruennichi]|uniref:nose resistant to fluoxetine protein 6-like n=1 Tax=Argiope bruennichi TaxID=94029 RepID=UPI002494182B|nr:nose resistant to fluoxetine protein 6-like [Argiope bruennichi]